MSNPTVPVRVLLVDDDERFAEIVRSVLEEGGYDVVGVTLSAAAVPEAVATLHPDVVVVDLVMPDADGLEVADALRIEGNDVPIVLFSSLFDHRIAEGTMADGYGYVEKAAGAEALEMAIDAAVELEPEID